MNGLWTLMKKEELTTDYTDCHGFFLLSLFSEQSGLYSLFPFSTSTIGRVAIGIDQ